MSVNVFSMWLVRSRNLYILRPILSCGSARWSTTPFSSNARTDTKSPNDEQQTSSEGTPTSETPLDAAKLLVERDSLLKEKETSGERIKELDDKYKRSLAENENLRQRMQRQIADAKLFGIQGFCKDLLEVADVLQQATASVPEAELRADTNPRLCSLHEGLLMTDTQLRKVFARHGLLPLDPPAGTKFDPNLHEALFQQPVPDAEPGTVAIVTKIGYRLHERTIRPALVGVVKKP